MTRHVFACSALDGIMQGFLLVGLPHYVIYFLPTTPIATLIALSTFCALFVAFLFLLFLRPMKTNRAVIRFCLYSTAFFATVTTLLFLLQFSVDLFPSVKSNPADGLITLTVLGFFVVFLVLTKMSLLLFIVVRNFSAIKTGDDSQSKKTQSS